MQASPSINPFKNNLMSKFVKKIIIIIVITMTFLAFGRLWKEGTKT